MSGKEVETDRVGGQKQKEAQIENEGRVGGRNEERCSAEKYSEL